MLFIDTMTVRNKISSFSKGFTLIELLIVIAVIGVLAAVVLVAIDPGEQFARGEDSGRKTSVSSLGKAIQAYYTINNNYPPQAAWNTTLISSGELKTFPTNPAGVTAPCAAPGVAIQEFCYKSTVTDAVVYTRLESKAERTKGTCAGSAANTWYVWSSVSGRAGVVCQAGEPTAGTTYTFF